jgi:hypothetical protein
VLLQCANTTKDFDEMYVAPSLMLIELHMIAGIRFQNTSSTIVNHVHSITTRSSAHFSNKKKGHCNIFRGGTSIALSLAQVGNFMRGSLPTLFFFFVYSTKTTYKNRQQ